MKTAAWLNWEWYAKQHESARNTQLVGYVLSSQFAGNTHERSKSQTSRFTKFESLCIVLFLVSDCDSFTVYASIPTVRWRQERVGRRENDQYGNYAHSTVHDTFKFLSINLHVRAVSDIAIYTSRIELPNLHIQGHNCHFPKPSHLVAIQKELFLLPLLSFISMTNCFTYQTVANNYFSERKPHFFATDFVKNKQRFGRSYYIKNQQDATYNGSIVY